MSAGNVALVCILQIYVYYLIEIATKIRDFLAMTCFYGLPWATSCRSVWLICFYLKYSEWIVTGLSLSWICFTKNSRSFRNCSHSLCFLLLRVRSLCSTPPYANPLLAMTSERNCHHEERSEFKTVSDVGDPVKTNEVS